MRNEFTFRIWGVCVFLFGGVGGGVWVIMLAKAEGGNKNIVGTCDSQHVFKNLYTTKRHESNAMCL